MVKKTVFSDYTAAERLLFSQVGRESRAAKVAEWRKLDLRQDFIDHAFMRECAKQACIKLPTSIEPATRARLLKLCRRAGILQGEITMLTGCSVETFMAKNERWPLWALLCSIAEMSCVHHGQIVNVDTQQAAMEEL